MKKLIVSKFLLMIFITISTSFFLIDCSSSKFPDGVDKNVVKWYNSHKWLNDLPLLPHESINQQEFSKQYHKNKIWWDEAFEFMKTQDLADLEPGQYIIDTGNVIATVSEVNPKDKDQVN